MGWLSRSVCLLIATLAVVLAMPGVAGAAPGDRLWRHLVPIDPALGLVDAANARVAVSSGTGDVYVAADLEDASGAEDFVVARYTSGGTYKWTRVYDDGASEMLSDIAADKNGNVVLCGTSYSDEKGWVFLTVKYSRSGERRWVRRLNGPGIIDWANEVVCGTDGAAYVAGMYDNGGTASSDMCLVKYRADGKRLWLRTYAKSDGAYELARGSDGKLYVAGARYSEMDGGGVVVIRYRPDGTRDWVRVVGPPDGLGQHVNDLAVRSSGVCVTGQLIDIDGGDSWGFVFKLRLDGTLRWQRAVAGESTYRACGIDGDGRVTIAGWAGDDFSLRRFSAIGRPAGTAAWHGSDTGALGIGEALAVTAAGNAYATGLVHNNDTGQDVWTVGMSSAWLPLFTVSYGSPTSGDDDGDDLALTTGGFYVAAVSDGGPLLIKYAR